MIVNVVDTHSSGAPCRVVVGGLEPLGIEGRTILEKKAFVQNELDWFRTSLLEEPRGHPALNADLALPATDPTADIALLILNQRPVGPLMSGGNILAFVTAVLEEGVLPMSGTGSTTVRVETPAGIVSARARCEGRKVTAVTVENVASYATHLDVPLEVPGIGEISVDVAYGGMMYLLVSAKQLGVELLPDRAEEIGKVAELCRAAANESLTVANPVGDGVGAVVDQVLVYGPPVSSENHGRSAVVMPALPGPPVMPTGAGILIDRCPCGTGTSAQVATLVAKGLLDVGQVFRQESIIGEVYEVTPLRRTTVGARDAIVPELTGAAHVYSRAEISVDKDDPLRNGFRVGDIWPGRVVPALVEPQALS